MTKALIVFVICGLVAGAIAQARMGRLQRDVGAQRVDTCSEGDWKQNRTGKVSLFEGITASEYAEVEAFMLAQKNLKLTPNDQHGLLTDDFMWSIEWDYPNKAAALAYLDGNGPKPDRAAKVTVYRGSKQDVVLYRVWPLPCPKFYTQIYYKRPIQWRARNPDGVEYYYFDVLFRQFWKDIGIVGKESFAGYNYSDDCGDRCLSWSDNAPRGTPSQRSSWFWWLAYSDAQYLHHIGLSIRIDHDGMDPTKWKVGSIAYNSVQFNTVADLIKAYKANKVPKIKLDPNTFNQSDWSNLYPKGTRPKGDTQVPPRTFEPEGHRWSLIGANTIQYLDWRFDFSIMTTTGLHIWDARYKGERIIYEWGVKEAMSAYSGYDIVQANALYIDTAWGLGTSAYELIAGSDCPYNAEFFDYSFWLTSGEIFTQKNAICVFEQDFSYPARRHFKTDYIGGYEWTSSQQATALVVRTTSPVFNYDYVFDFIFFPNGVVEAKFTLAGYIQAIYYSENNYKEDGYSTRVQAQTMGSIHQHIAAYKIDLDIGGTANTFQTVEFVPENRTSPFLDFPVISKKYVKTNFTKEVGIKSDFNRPMYWVFTNQAKKNKWGVEKGYRLSTNAATYLVGQEDPRLTGCSFAKYQIAVTRQKESEGGVNNVFCQAVPQICPQHLEDYLDNEPAYQQDLVAWIPMGSIHLPISEDIPTQETYGYTHSTYLRPYNYFDSDPNMNTRSGVQFFRLDRSSGSPVNNQEIKLKDPVDCLPSDHLDRFNGTSNTGL